MSKEQEILNFLEVKMFTPILESSSTSERFKKATRGLRIRIQQRDAQGMIKYFWNTVVNDKAKDATYGRMLKNEGFPEIEEVLNEFRVLFHEV